jgi:hypothetical protein
MNTLVKNCAHLTEEGIIHDWSIVDIDEGGRVFWTGSTTQAVSLLTQSITLLNYHATYILTNTCTDGFFSSSQTTVSIRS